MDNIKLRHPVALCRPDSAVRFFAVYVQRWLIFSSRFLFIASTWPSNRLSSGVQTAVMMESAVHCKAVLPKHVVTTEREKKGKRILTDVAHRRQESGTQSQIYGYLNQEGRIS